MKTVRLLIRSTLNEFDNRLTLGDDSDLIGSCSRHDYAHIIRTLEIPNIPQVLYIAAVNGSLNVIKYIVSIGADIHVQDDYAVRWASAHGHLDVVKYLVSVGSDIHAHCEYAFRLASAQGYLDVVKYLVSLGVDIRAQDSYAIRYASMNGHLEVVKYLVPAVVNNPHDKNNAVINAAYGGHLEVVRYLVSQGADIHYDNDCVFRCANNHPDVVQYLTSLDDVN
jgi:ankyrin repeat protein